MRSTSTGRPGSAQVKTQAGISDDAVSARTSRGWSEWYTLLDRAGARTMTHGDIAALLKSRWKCPGWWSQMITVAFERARGMRAKHQKPDGYEISRTLTVAAPPDRARRAFTEARMRAAWLGKAKLTRRAPATRPGAAKPPRALRFAWDGGASRLEVTFAARSGGRCQVSVQHGRLAGAREAARMKVFWGERLRRLDAILRGGTHAAF
jgi:uncharacterized protein YndB with AHSA1/START domain